MTKKTKVRKPRKCTEFQVGETVNVYALMNPRRDFKGQRIIEQIGPMYSDGDDMLWFAEGGSAHHPDACEKARTK